MRKMLNGLITSIKTFDLTHSYAVGHTRLCGEEVKCLPGGPRVYTLMRGGGVSSDYVVKSAESLEIIRHEQEH